MKTTVMPPSELLLAALVGNPKVAPAAEPAFWSWASTGPMGWKPCGCYGAVLYRVSPTR